MNRLTRITAILIHLQAKRIVTAKELADRFEVSLRTIYRDIRTLEEAGVPIGSENGVGYWIVAGYALPPIAITEEEANALIISEKLVQYQGDQSLKKDFESVLLKIKSVLKSFQKEKLEKLDHRIESSRTPEALRSQWLSTVQKAIANAAVLQLDYHSIGKDERTVRKVEPLGIYFTQQAWVLVAYCQLRKAIREFRLDRIVAIHVTAENFPERTDFRLTDYFKVDS